MADDFSELYDLAADLTDAPAEVAPFARKAVEVTARSIKDDWRQGAEISGGYASTYAASISYDMKDDASGPGAEIGPVLGTTPGASAGFLEEGGGGVDGPAHHAGRDAVEANEADFERGLEIALFDALTKSVGA